MLQLTTFKFLSLVFCLSFLFINHLEASPLNLSNASEISAELPIDPNAKQATKSRKQKRLEKRLKRKHAKALKKAKKQDAPKEGKSWVAALLLCFFLGILGIHRFYLGYIGIGIIQLLTIGLFGIWTLIDFILIIVKSLKPKNGEYID